jgi:CheY-like chemotaxis protein
MPNVVKVLVIDDSEVARSAICDCVRGVGLEPLPLATPIGATREIVRNQVSIVIIDVNMPSMRGDKLAAVFRANARFEQLKIILISGSPPDEMAAMAKAVRADAYVCKMDMVKELPGLLRRLVGELGDIAK